MLFPVPTQQDTRLNQKEDSNLHINDREKLPVHICKEVTLI